MVVSRVPNCPLKANSYADQTKSDLVGPQAIVPTSVEQLLKENKNRVELNCR